MLQLARCKGIDTSPAVTWTRPGPSLDPAWTPPGPWTPDPAWTLDPAPRVPEQIEVSTMSRQQGVRVSRHSWSVNQVWTCGLLQIGFASASALCAFALFAVTITLLLWASV